MADVAGDPGLCNPHCSVLAVSMLGTCIAFATEFRLTTFSSSVLT